MITSMPRVGYYSELDPFSGPIAATRENLPRVVRELQLFLLLEDIVILPPATSSSTGSRFPPSNHSPLSYAREG